MNRYSQYGEEEHIARICARISPQQRFYVDVGAHDWRELSNTYGLYEQGWCGVLVEPNEHYHREYRQHRPGDATLLAVCADRSTREPVTFYVNDVLPEMSTMLCSETERLSRLRGYTYREVQVPVTTLAQIGERFGNEPAVCSVDVEGAEGLVLAGRGRFAPCLFVIESLEHATSRDTTEQWVRLLPDYVYGLRTILNTFWVRRDLWPLLTEAELQGLRRDAADPAPAAL